VILVFVLNLGNQAIRTRRISGNKKYFTMYSRIVSDEKEHSSFHDGITYFVLEVIKEIGPGKKIPTLQLLETACWFGFNDIVSINFYDARYFLYEKGIIVYNKEKKEVNLTGKTLTNSDIPEAKRYITF
jgi:hypothetical protein